MKLLIQRCKMATVRKGERVLASIGPGLLAFLGVERGDGPTQVTFLAEKMCHLRIFAGGDGKMDRSALAVGAEIMVVSQFTLVGRTEKGRRPSFENAAPPKEAEALYRMFLDHVRTTGLQVASGEFGAMMEVELVNDGPVTFFLETPGCKPNIKEGEECREPRTSG